MDNLTCLAAKLSAKLQTCGGDATIGIENFSIFQKHIKLKNPRTNNLRTFWAVNGDDEF